MGINEFYLLVVDMIFLTRSEIYQHLKIKFLSLRDQVISSLYCTAKNGINRSSPIHLKTQKVI